MYFFSSAQLLPPSQFTFKIIGTLYINMCRTRPTSLSAAVRHLIIYSFNVSSIPPPPPPEKQWHKLRSKIGGRGTIVVRFKRAAMSTYVYYIVYSSGQYAAALRFRLLLTSGITTSLLLLLLLLFCEYVRHFDPWRRRALQEGIIIFFYTDGTWKSERRRIGLRVTTLFWSHGK